MKINPSILAALGRNQNDVMVADDSLKSFCEGTVMEDFLLLCDIPGADPQWCIDEIQKNLQKECGDRYSCLIAENDPSTVASLHDYRGRGDNYYAICGDVTDRKIDESKLQSACRGAYGNCWDKKNTADCMKDFLFTRADDVIYQYCPEGQSNVIVTLQENNVLMASQNPDGNTAQENEMPYQCVAYCTGGESSSAEPDNEESCKAMFPFEEDPRSVMQYLHSNLNYKTKITPDGVVIYKKYFDEKVNHVEAGAFCDQDSEDADVGQFLHLPMPRNESENQIYFDIIDGEEKGTWLDIHEVMPRTEPRRWVYKDGSEVTWLNWASGEPNNYKRGSNNELTVEMLITNGQWNDQRKYHTFAVCTYLLPAGAENVCTWLHDFEN